MKKIPTDALRKLYLKEKMSSNKIAKRYGCCKATILKRLRTAKIPMRDAGCPKLKLTEEQLRNMYLEKKISSWNIAKMIGCGRSSIHRKLVKLNINKDPATAHVKYIRKSFSEDPNEKAYLQGFATGDLRVRKIGKNSKTIKIDCGSTKKDQIDLIYKLFSKYGRVWISKPSSIGKTQIEAFVDDSFEFLLNCKTKIDWALESEYFIPFFAGFTDAEGSIFISDCKAKYSLGNYDYELLKKIQEKLLKNGIGHAYLYTARKKYANSEGYRQRQHYSVLIINRKKELSKLFDMLSPHIKHMKRREDMQKASENINKRN